MAGPTRAWVSPIQKPDLPRADDGLVSALAAVGRVPLHAALVGALDQRLEARFGLSAFRPWQEEAVTELLNGLGRVLVVAPTGGGKSLCYQFPATELDGTTLVISPLIALMEDQVRALQLRGIASTWLSSTVPREELMLREQRMLSGEYCLVYVAPERFARSGFLHAIRSLRPPLVAIDEAHCIAQWGHDFRPDYRRLGAVLETLQPPRVLACTATATPIVRDEILRELGLRASTSGSLQGAEGSRDARVILRGFARPNLHLAAEEVDRVADRRRRALDVLRDMLASDAPARDGVLPCTGSAIVYAGTRKLAEKVADEVAGAGFRAAAYHAGLEAEHRAWVNQHFAEGQLDVVVATNAFGMGIDRSDIRVVLHLQAPGSIEAYYQEVGRAGRDGAPAYGLLLTGASDFGLRRRLLEQSDGDSASGESLFERRWKMFLDLMRYAEAGSCRHDFILRYFADEQEMLGGCGHCDVCEQLDAQKRSGDLEAENTTPQDQTVLRQALSGVARVRGRAGLTAVADMLTGVRSKRLDRLGLTSLSTFGLLSGWRKERVLALLRRLITAELVTLAGSEFPLPWLTPRGIAVMKGEEEGRVLLPSMVAAVPAGKSRRSASTKSAQTAGSPSRGAAKQPVASDPSELDEELLERLREARLRVAKEQGVPAFVVLHDRTLFEIAAQKPQTLEALSAVKGIGPAKLDRYGAEILRVTSASAPV